MRAQQVAAGRYTYLPCLGWALLATTGRYWRSPPASMRSQERTRTR